MFWKEKLYTNSSVIHNMQKTYIFRKKRYNQSNKDCLFKDVLIILKLREGTEETEANNVTCFTSSFTI